MAAVPGIVWLVGYICINLLVTLLNKALLDTYDVPYPKTLVLWHYGCTAFGATVLVRGLKIIEPAQVDTTTLKKLFLFSILFNVNILVSTTSLHMVSMALHQIVRATCPAFTVTICYVYLEKRYSREVLMSLLVVFVGVSMYATKGEMDYTFTGLAFTIFGVFLAALKGVVTNVFMVGPLKLHPLDLLVYMCSFAFLQMFLWISLDGSLQATISHLQTNATTETYVLIVINGIGACTLNFVSFFANKMTSPLAMNIGGITKQVLAIILGIILFGTTVTPFGVLSVGITICGIVWYSWSSFKSRQAAADAALSLPPSPTRKSVGAENQV